MSDGLFSAIELGAGGPRTGYRLYRLEVFNWGPSTSGSGGCPRTARPRCSRATSVAASRRWSTPSAPCSCRPTESLITRRRARTRGNARCGPTWRVTTSRSGSRPPARPRPVGLRDHRHYSVILGVFANDSFDESVTLAQVFHQKDRAGQPDRFFVTSQKQLSIETDFTDFGSDLTDLRRRLRAGGAEIHAVFPDYARRARRLLGIKSEQAMELFHQTVSMKSVGNLNESSAATCSSQPTPPTKCATSLPTSRTSQRPTTRSSEPASSSKHSSPWSPWMQRPNIDYQREATSSHDDHPLRQSTIG